MKRIIIFMATGILLLSTAGCRNTSYAGVVSAEPEESSGILEKSSGEEAGEPEEQPEQSASESEEDKAVRISVKSEGYEVIYELNDSQAAEELCSQLPLTVEAEPFGSNEITFYPPEKLSVSDTPLGGGEMGSLAYYAPWGDVVMFYTDYKPHESVYQLGMAVSGSSDIEKLTGTITVSVCE